MDDFLNALTDFRRVSRFDEFFSQHQDLYAECVLQANELIRDARLEWFDSFFGARQGVRFYLLLALANGQSNYGISVETGGNEDVCSILGIWDTDFFGRPKIHEGMSGTIIHEFGHSYGNPIVLKHKSELETAGKRIFSVVRKQMEQQAYRDWQTLMLESVNRAAEVRYWQAVKGEGAARRASRGHIDRGFLWTAELADLLGEYEADRSRYPTLDDFFPRIVDFFDAYSRNLAE